MACVVEVTEMVLSSFKYSYQIPVLGNVVERVREEFVKFPATTNALSPLDAVMKRPLSQLVSAARQLKVAYEENNSG